MMLAVLLYVTSFMARDHVAIRAHQSALLKAESLNRPVAIQPLQNLPVTRFGCVLKLLRKSTLRDVVRTVVIYGVPIFWPVMLYAVLLLFSRSMRAAHLRRDHVLRGAIYAMSIGFWTAVAHFAFVALFALTVGVDPLLSGRGFPVVFQWQFVGSVGLMLFGILRLWVAYRCYLRIPHAFFVVLSVFVIVSLASAMSVLAWYFVV